MADTSSPMQNVDKEKPTNIEIEDPEEKQRREWRFSSIIFKSNLIINSVIWFCYVYVKELSLEVAPTS